MLSCYFGIACISSSHLLSYTSEEENTLELAKKMIDFYVFLQMGKKKKKSSELKLN